MTRDMEEPAVTTHHRTSRYLRSIIKVHIGANALKDNSEVLTSAATAGMRP